MLKGFSEKTRDRARRGLRAAEFAHQGAEFAGIEPDSMSQAPIEEYRRGISDFRLVHQTTTPRTAPPLLCGSDGGFASERLGRQRPARLLGQQLELAGIEPDTAAVGAPIDLDRFALDDQQCLTAAWTLH